MTRLSSAVCSTLILVAAAGCSFERGGESAFPTSPDPGVAQANPLTGRGTAGTTGGLSSAEQRHEPRRVDPPPLCRQHKPGDAQRPYTHGAVGASRPGHPEHDCACAGSDGDAGPPVSDRYTPAFACN